LENKQVYVGNDLAKRNCMRKSLFIPISIVLAVASITSCKKAATSTNHSGNTPTLFLSKFIKIDTTQSAPGDTSEIIEYSYDSQNRLSYVSDVSFMGGHDTLAIQTTSLYYNGNDTLFYKEANTYYSSFLLTNRTDTVYLAYNSLATLLSDSIRETNNSPIVNIERNQYSYINGVVIGNETGYSPGTYLYTDTATQIIANGDITYQIDTHNNSNFYTLDTHPNPFYTERFWIPVTNDIEAGFISQPKHNYTEIIESFNNTIVHHYNRLYTYLPNGYPSSFIEYSSNASGTPFFNGKGIFIYQ
jgi:hypothetical protein